MSWHRFILVVLLAAALVMGAMLWLRREEAAGLRSEIALLEHENRELAKLRSENQLIAQALPGKEKLAALRSDHAAILQMRGELEKLRDDLMRREKALAQNTNEPTREGTSPPLSPRD